MLWRLITGGVIGLTLACVSIVPAAAADEPDKAFVDRADGVCVRASIKLVKLPPPRGYNPNAKLTPKVLPALAPFLQKELAIDQSQVQQWSTIGTPTSPALRAAWNRWVTLWKTLELPALNHAAAEARRDDLKRFVSSYTRVHAHAREAEKLIKTLGFHDCDWSQ
jgi:hypothetical protein